MNLELRGSNSITGTLVFFLQIQSICLQIQSQTWGSMSLTVFINFHKKAFFAVSFFTPDFALTLALYSVVSLLKFFLERWLLKYLGWIIRSIQKTMFAIQDNTVLTIRQNPIPA